MKRNRLSRLMESSLANELCWAVSDAAARHPELRNEEMQRPGNFIIDPIERRGRALDGFHCAFEFGGQESEQLQIVAMDSLVFTHTAGGNGSELSYRRPPFSPGPTASFPCSQRPLTFFLLSLHNAFEMSKGPF